MVVLEAGVRRRHSTQNSLLFLKAPDSVFLPKCQTTNNPCQRDGERSLQFPFPENILMKPSGNFVPTSVIRPRWAILVQKQGWDLPQKPSLFSFSFYPSDSFTRLSEWDGWGRRVIRAPEFSKSQLLSFCCRSVFFPIQKLLVKDPWANLALDLMKRS